METTIDNSLPPLIYPYHVSPKIRDFTSSLLFYGKISVSLAGWISNHPIDSFLVVGSRANDTKHPLLPIFDIVSYHFEVAQKVALQELENLKPLGNCVAKVLTVYPGTPEHYELWAPLHDRCLPIAMKSLNYVHIMNVAATDFIFRIYELMLIFDSDPDIVLAHLLQRAKQLGAPECLLGECVLNRYTLPKFGRGEFVTDLADIAIVLGTVIGDSMQDTDTSDMRALGLSFSMFDHLLAPYLPKLNRVGIDQINGLMAERSDELVSMRSKCLREALEIVSVAHSERFTKELFAERLMRFDEEVKGIARLSTDSFNELLQSMLEDKTTWAIFSGFVGASVSGFPPSIIASLGVAAFSNLGASAFKTWRSAEKKLKESPWAFVHYVKPHSGGV